MNADGGNLYFPGAIFIIEGGRLKGSVDMLSLSFIKASYVIFLIGCENPLSLLLVVLLLNDRGLLKSLEGPPKLLRFYCRGIILLFLDFYNESSML